MGKFCHPPRRSHLVALFFRHLAGDGSLEPKTAGIIVPTPPSALVHGDADSRRNNQKLSPGDLQRCLEGQAILREINAEQLKPFLQAKPASCCDDESGCTYVLEYIKKDLTKNLSRDCNALRRPACIVSSFPNLCFQCEDEYFCDYSQSRQMTWNHLAKHFNLDDPKWPDYD